jgi:hypothetical protein
MFDRTRRMLLLAPRQLLVLILESAFAVHFNRNAVPQHPIIAARRSSIAPKIFTVLRAPVTGTCGGQPTRLQVACSVESCRKLALSVKISAQCRAWAFF